MIRATVTATALAMALSAASAQQAALPDFATCMDIEAERFEWRLRVHRDRALDRADFQLWTVTGVEYCGNIGITLCDRTEAPIACQQALTRQQEELAYEIRSHLPAPEAVAGEADSLPAQLYARTYALAHGISAGPDCHGADDPIRTWCETREAGNAVENAVLAWQVARYLGAAEPAIAAGWARPAPSLRPRPRPDDKN